MTLKAYLSPRRWRRLGWPGARMVAEVARAYRLYHRLESEPLPDMLHGMTDASPRNPVDPARLVKVTDWFLHPRYGPNRCMPRTVILLRMLARRGYPAAAVFGVSKGDSDLKGHAWIELDGEPLAEHEDPRTKYAETYRFQSDADDSGADTARGTRLRPDKVGASRLRRGRPSGGGGTADGSS